MPNQTSDIALLSNRSRSRSRRGGRMRVSWPADQNKVTQPEILVEAHDLSIAIGGRVVLDHVDIQVSRGEIVTVIGINGSGKTTLLRALMGAVPADRGHVRRLPGLRVGYAPQRLAVDPTLPLTVAHFLRLGSRATHDASVAALADVGAEKVLDSQLAALSGGELQRVMIARALLRAPDLLVLDEPMSGIDVSGQGDLYKLIGAIRDRHGCGILLVSHDLHLVMAATDTVVCLNHHVCCTGQPRAVVQDPEFIALFGHVAADTIAVYQHHHDHVHDAGGDIIPLDDEGENSSAEETPP
jgi:zinc transport system ATP-binding protein